MTASVAALACHPLKSGAPVPLEVATVDRWGVRGDRRWMVTEPDGAFVTARTDHRLLQVEVTELDGAVRFAAPGREPVLVSVPHDGELVDTAVWGHAAQGRRADDDRWFTALLGRPVQLLWCADPTYRAVAEPYGRPGDTVAFADAMPLLLASASSLDALQEWVSATCADRGESAPDLTMARLRPNVVVAGAPAWAEQAWTRVAIGDMTFRATKPCGRCVMPNIDLRTLAVGKEPLRTLTARNRIGGKPIFGIQLVPDAPGEVRVGDPVRVLDPEQT